MTGQTTVPPGRGGVRVTRYGHHPVGQLAPARQGPGHRGEQGEVAEPAGVVPGDEQTAGPRPRRRREDDAHPRAQGGEHPGRGADLQALAAACSTGEQQALGGGAGDDAGEGEETGGPGDHDLGHAGSVSSQVGRGDGGPVDPSANAR